MKRPHHWSRRETLALDIMALFTFVGISLVSCVLALVHGLWGKAVFLQAVLMLCLVVYICLREDNT